MEASVHYVRELVARTPVADIRASEGALLLGVIFSVFFFGLTTLQSYLYYLNYPKDRLHTRLAVLFVWVLEAARNGIAVYAMYGYLILEWGDTAALNDASWGFNANTILTGIIDFTVHSYFAFRVYVVSERNWYLTGIVAFFGFGNFVLSFATFGALIKAGNFGAILANGAPAQVIAMAALACAIIADLTTSVSLIYFLKRMRTKDFVPKRTDDILKRLIYFAVNVGMLTTAADATCIILTQISVKQVERNPLQTPSLAFYAIYEVIGNLYANSFLATLNARNAMNNKDDGVIQFSSLGGSGGASGVQNTRGAISVTTHQHVHHDHTAPKIGMYGEDQKVIPIPAYTGSQYSA